MAQNIHLKDRVRFLPTTKKKDLPPMFDCNFVATTIFNVNYQLPSSYDDWQTGAFNFNEIIGIDGTGTISALDQYIYNLGASGTPMLVINPAVDNEYPLYYQSNTVPSTGKHSGYIYYTVYDVQPTIFYDPDSGKPVKHYTMSVDIWESRLIPNDAMTYGPIN